MIEGIFHKLEKIKSMGRVDKLIDYVGVRE